MRDGIIFGLICLFSERYRQWLDRRRKSVPKKRPAWTARKKRKRNGQRFANGRRMLRRGPARKILTLPASVPVLSRYRPGWGPTKQKSQTTGAITRAEPEPQKGQRCPPPFPEEFQVRCRLAEPLA